MDQPSGVDVATAVRAALDLLDDTGNALPGNARAARFASALTTHRNA